MKVYLKIHRRELIDNLIETVAVCDEKLLDQVFKEGKLKIKISNQFFKGELINIDEAIDILKQAFYFNIVGENIINKAVDSKILSQEGIRFINGVPMAMKMVF